MFDVSRMIAPLTDADPQGGFPIGIAGLFSTASGIGEGARLAYTSLEAAGCAPSAFDLSPAFGQTEFTDKTERRELAPGSGTLIVHHNGPFMPHALWALGRARIRSRRIIGYWAWELPRLPDDWQPSFRYVHEIWVPSSFTRDSIAAATTKPVHVVPHPLPPMPVTPNMRARLGLPEDALIVLNVVHLGSAFARKNPLAAIAAFRRAFGDAEDRVLVIKLVTGGATQWAERALRDAIAGADNIRLVETMLPEADMLGLMAASDIVISLHRSEGFGLVPAQAMALGKPVIATGWSGNLEFMTERNSALVGYSLIRSMIRKAPSAARARCGPTPTSCHAMAAQAGERWRASRQDGRHRRRGCCGQAIAEDFCRQCRRPSIGSRLAPGRLAGLFRRVLSVYMQSIWHRSVAQLG